MYSIPMTMDVRIGMYDQGGNLIRLLSSGDTQPGSHLLDWDGTDEAGRPVPSGDYFLRVEVGAAGTVALFKVEVREAGAGD